MIPKQLFGIGSKEKFNTKFNKIIKIFQLLKKLMKILLQLLAGKV